MTEQLEKLTPEDGKSLDIKAQNIEQLKQLFPDVFREGKVDFVALKAVLGEHIENNEERYNFTWHGKNKARQIAQTPSTGTLRPCKEESVNWDTTQNMFIEGDNLEVLKLLQKSYHQKVKLIYIDPPYNTGKDFIYNDNFSDNMKNYLEYTGQLGEKGEKISSNTESSGRYHTNWLNMIYPRLKLARNLLRDDGAIFISIDEHELTNLTQVMNEIFGQDNHVATLTVINNMKGRNDKANVATCHEYLLIYSKGGFESLGLPLTEEQLSEYKHQDENSNRYALRDLRKRGRPDRREDRPKMYFPIYFNKKDPTIATLEVTENLDEWIEVTPKRGDGSDGRWRWGKDRVSNNLKFLHAKYSKQKDRWDVSHRVYLDPNIMSVQGDEEDDDGDQNVERTSKSKSFWWGGELSSDTANREFKKEFPNSSPDYPKSPFFLEKIIRMATSKDDLILDFFAGYGTTCTGALLADNEADGFRKFILVQIPVNIEDKYFKNLGLTTMADVSFERVKRSISRLGGGNVGIKRFKLDSSNINQWEPSFDNLSDILDNSVDSIKSERTSEDVLYEVLLKYGLDLTYPITEHDLAGKTVYDVAFGSLIVCLDDGITKEVVEGIGKLKQELDSETTRVVFKDAGFADDSVKVNAIQMLKQYGVDDVKSI